MSLSASHHLPVAFLLLERRERFDNERSGCLSLPGMPSRSEPPSNQDNDHGGVVQMPDSVSRAAESEKRNDTSPSQTSSPRTSEEVEFKEGGYGW